MSTNPFVVTPLAVAAVDPATGRHTRAVFFLGNVPRAVLEAARRGRTTRGTDPRKIDWTSADGTILKNFYGADWRSLLTAVDPPVVEKIAFSQGRTFQSRTATAPMIFSGGASPPYTEEIIHDSDNVVDPTEIFGGDNVLFKRDDSPEPLWNEGGIAPDSLWNEGGIAPDSLWADSDAIARAARDNEQDFGDLGALDDIKAAAALPAKRTAAAASLRLDFVAAPPVFTDITVYPEDTIFDLRLKIQLATGVEVYRQHLFYYVNDEGPVLPYRFTLDGAPVVVDWRATARDPSGGVAGIQVDPRLEERREGIHIAALDTFTLLSPSAGIRVTSAYYVDLFAVIPPLKSSERPNDNLAAILRDRYQFDILYFGGLLRYWPQLSPEACNIALTDPAKLAEAAPLLSPDAAELAARFKAEREVAEVARLWRAEATKGGRQTTAVTAATVRVTPNAVRMRANIRNIFDWIPVGINTAASVAKFNIDAALLSDAGAVAVGPDVREGGLIPVTAAKRHASSYGPKTEATIGWFVERAPRRDTVTFALARRGAQDDETAQTIPYTFLTVHADGRTEATADWREDDRVGFDAVTKEISQIVAPTIEAINAMGPIAFPIGGSLSTGQLTGSLGAITVSAFWPHALSSAGFREIKSRFRVYERAGVVGIRGLQQGGAYTFAFKKGVVAYDPRLADRAEARGHSGQNQYSWLTDATAQARWAISFPGRTIRVYHRATDLRVEIIGADSLSEFDLIKRYIFSFLDGALSGPNRIRVVAADAPPERPLEASSTVASHRLRRLQERDPNLFDLKKYNPNATVYSVLCQSGRQPHVFNAAEMTHLNAKQRAALVRYWNFTDKEPAYYQCPNPRYPHLSFRAGQHPLGYCLPCCKKTRAAVGSRAALTNKTCLSGHCGEADKDVAEAALDTALSRHVLTYGKTVPVGRISDVATEVSSGLFLDVLPSPYRLQMVGVEQSVPAIPNAGFAYALAYAVGELGSPPQDVFTDLARLAAEMGDTYYALGGGSAAAFASAEELSSAITTAFINLDPALSPFGPGGAAAETWPAIFGDLARHLYGVEIVTLADPTGSGEISLEALPDAAAAIAARLSDIRLVIVASGPMGVYPIVATNPKFFLRVSPDSRWMAARRTFIEEETAPGVVSDTIYVTVRDALGSVAKIGNVVPDLALITRYSGHAESRFKIETRLADMHNMCYGIILRAAATSAAVYIPVRNSAYPVDGTPVQFGPRPDLPLPADALDAAIADINKYIKKTGEPFAPIEAGAILYTGDRRIGFATPGVAPLYFYHDGIVGGDDAPAKPKINFPYSPREIDIAIVSTIRDRTGTALPVSPLAQAASARNRLYRLFVAEFSAVISADRSVEMRQKIMGVVKATKYDSAKSVAALRKNLLEILHEYPDDLRTVRDIIAKSYADNPQNVINQVRVVFEATSFEFDRQTIARLRSGLSRAEIARELRTLLAPRIEISDHVPTLQNLYSSCQDESAVRGVNGPCKGRRLLVPANRIDDFYDILAADIENPGKTSLLNAISAGVFDPLDFSRRPGERLTVKLG